MFPSPQIFYKEKKIVVLVGSITSWTRGAVFRIQTVWDGKWGEKDKQPELFHEED